MPAPWRLELMPASFNGAEFHVEINAKSSGRRVAMHEFAKKDVPYAEDMGRRARRFVVTGYIVQSPYNGFDYRPERDALVAELEREGPGVLVLPTQIILPTDGPVQVDTYTVHESRERGGYAEFDMAFVEAGVTPSSGPYTDTQSVVNASADDATDVFQSAAAAVSYQAITGQTP